MSQKPDSNFQVEQAAATDDSIQQVHAQLRSQKPEKKDGYSLLPLALLGIMCTAVFFGSIYMAHNAVRFDPLVVNEHAKREKPGKSTGPAVTRAQMGKPIYLNTCAVCHTPAGTGVPGQFPPLAGSEWVKGNEERIIRIVQHGLTGPITVAGHEFNNTMTPVGATLKDEQVANVLSYIRSAWDNNAPEVQPETVAKVRGEIADRKTPWTSEELLKVGGN
ncbi:MAG TPA: cytochrome c [Lacunisphaera sp.]|nr:cytochrome c [Lacunisphaera sp.]